MEKLVKLLESHPDLSLEEMSLMLGKTTQEVAASMDELKNKNILKGKKAIINWDSIKEANHVSAFIDVQVQPKRNMGFDEVARVMTQIPDVECCYLMSGGYDILLKMKGKSFQDIALFVAMKLSTVEGVLSTTTHFVLKRYKEDGIIMETPDQDDRGNISL